MNIVCLGDVVGRPGREILAKELPLIRKEFNIDFAIVNGENACAGSGILPKHADEIFASGADAITLGDHVWDKPEIVAYLEATPRIVRPYNFPEGTPGRGFSVITTQNGVKVGIINLLGRSFMRYNVNCPFRAVDEAYAQIVSQTKVIVLDMHAETTSEKVAMGHYANGRLSAVFGTHTHVQTADEQILPEGTAYITDLGMSGPYDSVIGQDKHKIIKRFLTSLPQKFEVAQADSKVSGVVITVDEQTGRASKIVRLQRPACRQAGEG